MTMRLIQKVGACRLPSRMYFQITHIEPISRMNGPYISRNSRTRGRYANRLPAKSQNDESHTAAKNAQVRANGRNSDEAVFINEIVVGLSRRRTGMRRYCDGSRNCAGARIRPRVGNLDEIGDCCISVGAKCPRHYNCVRYRRARRPSFWDNQLARRPNNLKVCIARAGYAVGQIGAER